MNVGIVGCGLIAEKHVSFIRSMRGVKIVGIVDRDSDRLHLFSKKYEIENCYQNFTDLLDSHEVDILHILTPPLENRDIAFSAIKNGIHLYIEKPIALTAEEVREIYRFAESRDVKVCAGYNLLYEPMFLEALEQIQKPEFGKVVHVESHYGMNMRRYDRQKTTKDNKIHWSYDLPGGFNQNYISHPLYLLVKFIEAPRVREVLFRSNGALPQNICDEIKVLIEGDNATGLLALSYSSEPYKNYLKIIGEKQTIKIDWFNRTKIHYKSPRLPKVLTHIFYDNLSEAGQLVGTTIKNTVNIITKRYVSYQGIKTLIDKFYHSIQWSLPSPIPSELAITTEEMSENIMKKCTKKHLNFTPRKSFQKNIKHQEKILVTGASGLVGLATVRLLVEHGYFVRALVRKLSYISELEKMGIEIYFGDVRDYDSFKAAAEGVDTIVHLAAATKGPAKEFLEITVGGVENLLKMTRDMNIARVIYMSSMSVYDLKDCKRGQVLDEDHTLERHPEDRGPYTLSKTKAEKLVLGELSRNRTTWTILRPSVIFGRGKNIFFGSLGFSIGKKLRILIGPGNRKIRLIHVDDVANAVILSLKNDISRGKIYNIDYPVKISKNEYVRKYIVPKNGKGLNLYIPYTIFYSGVFFVEVLFFLLKRKPFLTRYRLMSSQKDVHFDISRIQNDLGWNPILSLDDSMRETFDIS